MMTRVLEINRITYTIGSRQLLNIEKLEINDGERVGLIGRNGCGKTTLLSILNQEIQADVGHFRINGRQELLHQLKTNSGDLSGGELTQKALIDLLNQSPKLLMLDEPTNNLDRNHIEWLQKSLAHYRGAMIIVSHDRAFLDQVCTQIWTLADGKIGVYSGNYSDYEQQKELGLVTKEKAYQAYRQEKSHLEQAILLKKAQAVKVGKPPKNKSYSEINAKGAKPHYGKVQKNLHQTVKALESRLNQLEQVDQPRKDRPIVLSVPDSPKYVNKIIVRVEQLEGKINNKLLWQPSTFFIKSGDKIALIGDKGVGKTTLVKKLLQQNESGIVVSPYARIGYFAQGLETLRMSKSLIENVMVDAIQKQATVRAVLHEFGFDGQALQQPIESLSGGERVKAALAKLLVADYNFFILDEPTNHLDVQNIEALERLLQAYQGTLIIISHDSRFVSKIANRTLLIRDKKLTISEEGPNSCYQIKKPESTKRENDEQMLIEMEITKVLSQLSVESSPELEERYDELMKRRNK